MAPNFTQQNRFFFFFEEWRVCSCACAYACVCVCVRAHVCVCVCVIMKPLSQIEVVFEFCSFKSICA